VNEDSEGEAKQYVQKSHNAAQPHQLTANHTSYVYEQSLVPYCCARCIFEAEKDSHWKSRQMQLMKTPT
jgi:hypothetical protein